MDTFFLRAKQVSTIIPGQGVSVSNYIYWCTTLDPTTPSQNQSYLGNAEFNLYRQMYDKFRVNSVHIKVIPKANVLDQATGQLDSAYNLSGDGVVHTCIDRDGVAPSSIAAISRYPSYKRFDVKKNWSRSYSISYPKGVWLDCQSPATFSMTKELGLSGGITFYAENLLEDNNELYNEPYAQIECYYNIVFQGKTSAQLSAVLDGSGSVVGVTVTNPDTTPNRAFTVPRNVRGTLQNDTRLTQTGISAPPQETAITDASNV